MECRTHVAKYENIYICITQVPGREKRENGAEIMANFFTLVKDVTFTILKNLEKPKHYVYKENYV